MTEIAKLHLDDAGYVRDCLDKVSASSSHLLTLVNDILDISKVESGRMTLDPCAVSLSEEVEKLSGMGIRTERRDYLTSVDAAIDCLRRR